MYLQVFAVIIATIVVLSAVLFVGLSNSHIATYGSGSKRYITTGQPCTGGNAFGCSPTVDSCSGSPAVCTALTACTSSTSCTSPSSFCYIATGKTAGVCVP